MQTDNGTKPVIKEPRPMIQRVRQTNRWVIGGILLVLVITGWWGYKTYVASSTSQTQYQTAQAEKGTLVVSVSGSGQVSAANNASITTEAAGVVKTVYVKDGDLVTAGDKIAELDLDLTGQQRNAAALASYQSAKNAVDTAQNTYYTLQSDLFTKWQTLLDLSKTSTYQNGDGTAKTIERSQNSEFITVNDNWLAAEAKYKQQQEVLGQAKTSLSSAWLSYQQTSPIIYAPISGTVTGLSLQEGTVIVAQSSSTSTNTTTSQKVASIKTNAPPSITLNLSEIDTPKVKVGQKVTISFNAFADKTYTGKVVSVDTIGSVSSGVTTYPTVIRLDTQSNDILPNMAVTGSIITNTKDDVLLVPSTALKTQNGATTVQVMQNGQPQTVTVTAGDSSDTQTEILTGLSEGDTVVTGTTTTGTTTRASGATTSVFGLGGVGGRGGFGR